MHRLSIFLLTSSSLCPSSSFKLTHGRVGWQGAKSLLLDGSCSSSSSSTRNSLGGNTQYSWLRFHEGVRSYVTGSSLKAYDDDYYYDDDEKEEDNVENKHRDGNIQHGRRNKTSRKFRQHVNPLASSYQQPTQLESDWIHTTYSAPSRPFIIDIGCSKGAWAIEMCEANQNTNILGIEIRKPVVNYALERRDKRRLTNLHFIQANVNVDISRIINDIQEVSSIDMICIQFPDPHFKAKHKKRRVVNESFVQTLSDLLPKGTGIFMQSDVEEVIVDMIESFSSCPDFQIAEGYSNGPPETLSSNKNPTHFRTEREISVQKRELPVYRMLFIKT